MIERARIFEETNAMFREQLATVQGEQRRQAELLSNLVSAAIRLVPLGQNQGQRLLAGIEPAIRTARDHAADLPLSRLTTNCLMADICSMQHETQHTRLFRS